MESALTQDHIYPLGHTPEELERLIAQERFIGDLTEQMLRLAGLQAGMRVLDMGCGAGDVSFLALRLIGRSGFVIGIDKSPDAIALAQERARQAGLSNVQFIATDLDTITLDEPVDALIGRLILMYFRQPSAALRRLLQFVKPGGIVTFQEIDALHFAAEPMCEEFRDAAQRIIQTLMRVGVDIRAALKLPFIFQNAGLPAPQMLQLARVEYGAESMLYNYMEQLTRSLLPVMQQTGVATADEVRVDTLASRMREEVVAKNAVVVMPPFIGAWTHKAVA